MKFQGSGFSIDVPEDAMDASSYAFVFPQLGDFSPNLTIRFESGENVNLEERINAAREALMSSTDDLVVIGEDPVRARGDWKYSTQVYEYGDAEHRVRQKQLVLLVSEPKPTLYTLTGTDLAVGFPQSEPVFDQIIRSFDPNAIQRIN